MLVALGAFAHKYFTATNTDFNVLEKNIHMIISKVPFTAPNHLLQVYDCICYSVFQEPSFTLCFFQMRRNHEMPLHDHPDMTVFLYYSTHIVN
jgi:hypothetical protein